MFGNTISKAYASYLNRLQATLHCVTWKRVTTPVRPTRIDTIYSVALNNMDPTTLAGEYPIDLTVGQYFRIVRLEQASPRGAYAVRIAGYFYSLSVRSERNAEVMSFHWTPDAAGEHVRRFPHLHIGTAIIGTAISHDLPPDLARIHVPTGNVSLESIIRLAIDEFKVTPITTSWRTILSEAEAASSLPTAE